MTVQDLLEYLAFGMSQAESPTQEDFIDGWGTFAEKRPMQMGLVNCQFQFGLRWLLLFVLPCALLSGYLALRMHRANEQHKAVEWIGGEPTCPCRTGQRQTALYSTIISSIQPATRRSGKRIETPDRAAVVAESLR